MGSHPSTLLVINSVLLRALLLLLMLVLLHCPTHASAKLCLFQDGGLGVTEIQQLGLGESASQQIRDHVLANVPVPSQLAPGGRTTILFDTP